MALRQHTSNQRQSRPWTHAIFVEKFYNIGPGYPDTCTHHTARRYSCGNCTKQYRRKEDLAKHAKKYDGIPPATDDALSVTPPAVNTPKGSPTSYTIVSLYDTWFENMGEQDQ